MNREVHVRFRERLRGKFPRATRPEDSDLDLLVDPTPETTLFDIAKIQVELKELLGIAVDVLTPRALPDKFREHVIQEAQPV